jgi:virulence factor Mce-like protein
MKRILISAAILLAVGAFMVLAGGASNGGGYPTYKIQLDNAFGLVTGADFKVAGVRAGTISSIDLDPKCAAGNPAACYALVTVQITQKGFGSFRSDAFCQSRPQSLIGEYFVDCQPGQSGRSLPSGSTIPVTHTQSTIAADLVQNVMQMPYRERFTLIINELGAAVAGRSGDLQAALGRAVPALTETDNLLHLLANDSQTIKQLNVNADSVITALANNKAQVQRFIVEANNTATDTAKQSANFKATWAKLPGFLEQLRPSMAQLGAAADANEPVLANLNGAASDLARFFRDLVPFSHASQPAIRSLGQASRTGIVAVKAAGPTVADLNRFARPTPELAQNLAIVLHDLDDRSRAVEPDVRSPGGRGFTGLEALLQYVFNQTNAINTFGTFGHQLTVDAFVSGPCSPYATPQTVASGLQQNGPSYRQCYSWLGSHQPAVNEPDPSNPGACVPDPNGAPPGKPGPGTSACKLNASPLPSSDTQSKAAKNQSANGLPTLSNAPAGVGAGGSQSGSGSAAAGGVKGAIGQILSAFGGGSGASAPASAAPQSSSSTSTSSSSAPSSGQTQQLLNYLLSP